MKTTILPLALASLCFALQAADGPSPLVTRQQPELLRVLQSDADTKAKADACRELTVVGTRDAIPVLVTLLNDEKLAHMARYALETIPDRSVDAALREQLGKLQGRRLVGVIGSLGVRRDLNALNALAGHLYSGDPEVVEAAARSLGQLGTLDAAEAILGAVTDPAHPNIVALADGIARCAERLLAEGKTDAALAIYDRYQEPGLPHQVKTAAFRGAILARGSQGAELIRQELAGQDPVLFATAIRTSYELKDPAVTRTLANALPRLNPDGSILVMQALGGRRDPAGLPALLAATKSGDASLRATAVRAAGEIGHPSAINAYLELMADPNRDISNAAQEALAATTGPEADQAVLQLFQASDPKRRLAGMDLIARRRMTSAVPELIKAAGDPAPPVRTGALRRLAELAGPSDLPALLGLLAQSKTESDLENAEESIAAVAARVTPPENAATQIAAWLYPASPLAKASLVRILTTLGGPTALRNARAAVQDPNEDVRAAAIRSLGAWRSTETAPDLLQLARSATDDKTRLLCLRSYLGMAANTDLPSQDRLAMCRQAGDLIQRDDEKKLLLAALGGIPSIDALALVVPLLDSTVKGEAAAAALAIIPKILQNREAAAPHLAKMAEALEKVLPAATNPDQTQRAKTLLERIKSEMK